MKVITLNGICAIPIHGIEGVFVSKADFVVDGEPDTYYTEVIYAKGQYKHKESFATAAEAIARMNEIVQLIQQC